MYQDMEGEEIKTYIALKAISNENQSVKCY